jgi:hypothetical protein
MCTLHKCSDCTVSLTNALGTDKKNYFLVETTKAVTVTKSTFSTFHAIVFYNMFFDNSTLLQEIHFSVKSKTYAQEEQPTPSTPTEN